MKKALSLFLAILMVFSAFSVGTFAEGDALTVVSAKVGNLDLQGAEIPGRSIITLTFSADVTASAVLEANKAKITVASGTTAAAAEVKAGSEGTKFDVTLGENLSEGSYTLTIAAGLKDKDNNELAEAKTYTFTLKNPTTNTNTSNASFSATESYLRDNGYMTDKDMVFVFYIDRGTYFQAVKVWDSTTNRFVNKTPEEMKDIDPYVMFPDPKGFQEPGAIIQLPFVTAPAGWNFTGWYCVEDATPYAAGYGFEIPTTYKNQKDANNQPKSTAGGVYTFKAMYNPAEVEEDTFAKVFEILAKIFGTILGLIAYEGDTAAGIAFVRRVFGGITG